MVAAEKIRLRIADLGKAVLVSGQAYQDPKDALNEFVSNAADDYAEAGLEGGRTEDAAVVAGRRCLPRCPRDGREPSPVHVSPSESATCRLDPYRSGSR